jgi:magnesium transporter
MARFISDRLQSQGTAPGSLIFIGMRKMEKPTINLFDYDRDSLTEKPIEDIAECKELLLKNTVTWVNINGLHDEKLIEKTGEIFGLHPLFLEDLMNTGHMPKYVNEPDYDAFIMKMLKYDSEKHRIIAEQFGLVLGKNFVLTFQEQKGDVFDPLRQRIRNHKGRVRLNDNDYLAYALLDTLVDNYILSIERVGREIESIDEILFSQGDEDLSPRIYNHKLEINYLRKSIRPVKEMVFQVQRGIDNQFQKKNKSFLGDLADLTNQATDAIELYSSILSRPAEHLQH